MFCVFVSLSHGDDLICCSLLLQEIPMNHPEKVSVAGSGMKNRYKTIIPSKCQLKECALHWLTVSACMNNLLWKVIGATDFLEDQHELCQYILCFVLLQKVRLFVCWESKANIKIELRNGRLSKSAIIYRACGNIHSRALQANHPNFSASQNVLINSLHKKFWTVTAMFLLQAKA